MNWIKKIYKAYMSGAKANYFSIGYLIKEHGIKRRTRNNKIR